jgi:hypothetical protein
MQYLNRYTIPAFMLIAATLGFWVAQPAPRAEITQPQPAKSAPVQPGIATGSINAVFAD